VTLPPAVDVVATRASFTVYGLPVPQGSKNAIRQGPRTLIVERGRAKLNPWRGQIASTAAELLDSPIAGPLEVELTFSMPRPKAHFRSGSRANELRDDAPVYLSSRPDVDKLARAVLDALTGVAFLDDGQVASLVCAKVYGDRPGVAVAIRELV
jgi:Holliday junction resolvase RusA-like endonuclease